VKKTYLWIIRHGAARGNRKHILNGNRLDPPLTAAGKAQAKEIAEKWHARPEVIISSPLKRAMQTAEYFAKKYSLPVIIEPLIAEQDCGRWTGKSLDSLTKKYPSWFFHDRGKPTHYPIRIPGGESWNDAKKRARKFLKMIETKYTGKKVLAFSHGVFMQACTSVFYGIRPPKLFRCYLRNLYWDNFEFPQPEWPVKKKK